MMLARVIGRSWSSIKHRTYNGRIVFHVQPVRPDGSAIGRPFLAVDAVGAGPGELVLVAREGNTARQVLEAPEQPVHAVVMGIVDEVSVADAPKGSA